MNSARPKVVVLGGGFGGLETAFYLRMRLHDRADITIVSDRDYFMFKPNTIYIPFGLDPDALKIDLAKPTHKQGITFIRDRVREIDPLTRMVLAEHQQIPYDFLVVATGAGMRPDEVSGLGEYAETVWTAQDMLKLRLRYYNLVEDAKAGRRQQVLFLVPPNNKCSGPLYEMVMMLDTWLRRKGVRRMVDLNWSTYESGYIQAFGPRLHTTVSEEFATRGIVGHTEYVVEKIEPGAVRYQGGHVLPYHLLVAFPPYAAAATFAGLPSDTRGFIATQSDTRQVVEHPEIYAVGDAGDFPVKQAFLAFLQADAAAEHLAAQILGEQPAFEFEPVSMCVMEQLDKATFAQVPLRYTGIAEKPLEVIPGSPEYKVGSGALWRLGKMALGLYLPWRFGAGNAFHAGLPWKGMEMGLKVMSGVLAN
ncbi:MAG: FAD/NAD(P)-binding oxidoreductase [Roseiflexaceae bacterium]